MCRNKEDTRYTYVVVYVINFACYIVNGTKPITANQREMLNADEIQYRSLLTPITTPRV